jgi:hypothetical protein
MLMQSISCISDQKLIFWFMEKLIFSEIEERKTDPCARCLRFTGALSGLFFDPEDGYSTFLRNVSANAKLRGIQSQKIAFTHGAEPFLRSRHL